MAENRFAKSVQAAKANTEKYSEQQKASAADKEIAEVKSPEKPAEDSKLLKELFPRSGRESNFKSHSVYLSDAHWKKIQKIAKDQNISSSAVLTKILDKVL